MALSTTTGPVLEEIILARDEAANMVWGIEMFVSNDLGESTEMLDFWGNHLLVTQQPPASSGLHYTLISNVPANWLPFSPRLDQSVTPARARALELIPFVRTASNVDLVAVRPLGALLNKEDPPGTYRLNEEAVNRIAQRVVRRFERARSADGRVHIWVSLSRATAQPQVPSGLSFDTLLDHPE